MMVEATEHHEIVFEVESELRGLRKALDIMLRNKPRFRHQLSMHDIEYENNWGDAVKELQQEIEFVQGVLDEWTTDGDGE